MVPPDADSGQEAGQPVATNAEASDGDAGDVAATTPGTVTVNLGNVPAGSPARAIEFKVIID